MSKKFSLFTILYILSILIVFLGILLVFYDSTSALYLVASI